jgi:hypothetical protein
MAKTVAGRVTHFHQANFDEEPYRKRKEVQRVLLRKKKKSSSGFRCSFHLPGNQTWTFCDSSLQILKDHRSDDNVGIGGSMTLKDAARVDLFFFFHGYGHVDLLTNSFLPNVYRQR